MYLKVQPEGAAAPEIYEIVRDPKTGDIGFKFDHNGELLIAAFGPKHLALDISRSPEDGFFRGWLISGDLFFPQSDKYVQIQKYGARDAREKILDRVPNRSLSWIRNAEKNICDIALINELKAKTIKEAASKQVSAVGLSCDEMHEQGVNDPPCKRRHMSFEAPTELSKSIGERYKDEYSSPIKGFFKFLNPIIRVLNKLRQNRDRRAQIDNIDYFYRAHSTDNTDDSKKNYVQMLLLVKHGIKKHERKFARKNSVLYRLVKEELLKDDLQLIADNCYQNRKPRTDLYPCDDSFFSLSPGCKWIEKMKADQKDYYNSHRETVDV